METRTKDACVEILTILNLLEDEKKKQIPENVIEFFEENKSENYFANIVPDTPLENQKLLPETIDMLAVLKLNYWCDDKEEKEKLISLLNGNEKKYQNELIKIRERNNSNNIFKNKENIENNIIKEDDYITIYKESLFKRIKKWFENKFLSKKYK